jgi:hypothetical protein
MGHVIASGRPPSATWQGGLPQEWRAQPASVRNNGPRRPQLSTLVIWPARSEGRGGEQPHPPRSVRQGVPMSGLREGASRVPAMACSAVAGASVRCPGPAGNGHHGGSRVAAVGRRPPAAITSPARAGPGALVQQRTAPGRLCIGGIRAVRLGDRCAQAAIPPSRADSGPGVHRQRGSPSDAPP